MSPHLLLSLWRERWGKTAEASLRVPYLQGKPTTFGKWLTHAHVWSLTGVRSSVLTATVVIFVWMLSIRFSLGGQVAFSLLLAGFALYLQRYKGTLVTLTLLGLSLLVSARYLGWRFTATLGHGFNFDFVLGFGLCVAELHLWMLGALGLINTLCPLKQAMEPLPESQSSWPTVDIYLPTRDQSQDAVLQTCTDALALDWPREKLRIFLLDGTIRPPIQYLAESLGVTYLASLGSTLAPSESINLALRQTEGELVLICEGDAVPEKDFLKMTIGWFLRDRAIGFLQTRQDPPDTELGRHNPALLPSAGKAIPCALFRRSLAVEFSGQDLGTTTPYAALTSELRKLGYRSGDIGFSSHPSPAIGIFRMDHSFSGTVPLWKMRLVKMLAMLHFYFPVALWVFFTAPFAGLVAGVHLIQSDFASFAAYAVAHVLHGHLVRARLSASRRLTLWADVRNTLLGWYMFLPTTVSTLRTEFHQQLAGYRALVVESVFDVNQGQCRPQQGSSSPKIPVQGLAVDQKSGGARAAVPGVQPTPPKLDKLPGSGDASMPPPLARFHWTKSLPFSVVLSLNLLGLTLGLARLDPSGGHGFAESVLYLLWSVCNLVLLAAKLAVAQERRHIEQHVIKLSRLPAMIQTPSGHTLRCVTENFPSTTLAFSLPALLQIENESEVSVSIFFDHHEFNFSGRVDGVEENLLHVRIDEVALNEYQFAASAIFSRGPDWPQWLPGRNSDHPLPQWITTRLSTIFTKTIALMVKIGNTIKSARSLRWIQKRTNAT